ncbi:hypothetical protein [Rufibacter quisquiliarum]|uniref:Glucose/arabinose dehydrogenase n=2 Tax=Rufibacter quisquiliarum TaxID=1549639 RepID=A0A839GUQ5_9BACT|nr:hypothetical protein [Rufibacter quisquiliarum]MBA9078617.1 glucose/arabinose dehydrogenase [Rufibacter quisquiliarum]
MRTMPQLLFVLIFSIFCTSCQSAEPKADKAAAENIQPEQKVKPNAAVSAEPAKAVEHEVAARKYDYLEWDSILINNRVPLSTNRRVVEKHLGKPDSVVTPDYAHVCGNCHFCVGMDPPPYKLVYIKGLRLEQLQDSIAFWGADFRKNKKLFLTDGKTRFDRTTTLEKVKKLFNYETLKRNEDTGGFWIRLQPSKIISDASFILEFDESGYLTEFNFYFPC